VDLARHGTLHHVELWVPNLDRAVISWGWLLGELGYEVFQDWPGGKSGPRSWATSLPEYRHAKITSD